MSNHQRHVVVTGAAEGVGRSIAQAFAREGARVVIVDIQSADETVRLIREAGGNVEQVSCDVSSEASVQAAIPGAAELLDGRIDALVNNAGTNGHYHLLEDMPLAAWEETLRVNLTGTMLVTREATRFLPDDNGTIVNVSSNVGKRGLPYRGDYVASKWALIGLTQTAALELAPRGIRVNAVCPGPIEGNRIEDVMRRHAEVEGTSLDGMRERWESESPLGRFVTPDEVASVVRFLASADSSAMTGQAINVTAGLVMH